MTTIRTLTSTHTQNGRALLLFPPVHRPCYLGVVCGVWRVAFGVVWFSRSEA